MKVTETWKDSVNCQEERGLESEPWFDALPPHDRFF